MEIWPAQLLAMRAWQAAGDRAGDWGSPQISPYRSVPSLRQAYLVAWGWRGR